MNKLVSVGDIAFLVIAVMALAVLRPLFLASARIRAVVRRRRSRSSCHLPYFPHTLAEISPVAAFFVGPLCYVFSAGPLLRRVGSRFGSFSGCVRERIQDWPVYYRALIAAVFSSEIATEAFMNF